MSVYRISRSGKTPRARGTLAARTESRSFKNIMSTLSEIKMPKFVEQIIRGLKTRESGHTGMDTLSEA